MLHFAQRPCFLLSAVYSEISRCFTDAAKISWTSLNFTEDPDFVAHDPGGRRESVCERERERERVRVRVRVRVREREREIEREREREEEEGRRKR